MNNLKNVKLITVKQSKLEKKLLKRLSESESFTGGGRFVINLKSSLNGENQKFTGYNTIYEAREKLLELLTNSRPFYCILYDCQETKEYKCVLRESNDDREYKNFL